MMWLFGVALVSSIPRLAAFQASNLGAPQHSTTGIRTPIYQTMTGTSKASSGYTVAMKRKTSSLHSTWSNGQAVQGYQDFLSSGKQEIELTLDTGSVFVYGNPTYDPYNNIINALLSMGRTGQHEDLVLPSSIFSPQQQGGESIQELPETLNGQYEYPIYICIPPTQLGYFLDNLSPSYMNRIDDFVFFSGGFEFGNVEDVLKERGTYTRGIPVFLSTYFLKLVFASH